MKAVVTVTAKDTKGIIAKVTTKMFEYGANVLDISQSLVGEYFAMIMLIEMDEKEKKFLALSDALKELGEIETERIEITNKGADWEGLMNAIAASDIENSEEIIDEIKSSSNREETLKDLMEQYPQIKQLLPQLRRASVVITTIK